MANVVRVPKTHPDAIIPDLSKRNPLVKFTKEDIAFVYGSKWKQRYFTKKGDARFRWHPLFVVCDKDLIRPWSRAKEIPYVRSSFQLNELLLIQ